VISKQDQSSQNIVEEQPSFDKHSEINEVSKTSFKEPHSPGVTSTSTSNLPIQTSSPTQITSTMTTSPSNDNKSTQRTEDSDNDSFKARLSMVFSDFINEANSLVENIVVLIFSLSLSISLCHIFVCN
jgi:hypothetical protein